MPAVTGKLGDYEAVWVLGPKLGTQTVTARSLRLPPVTFTATAGRVGTFTLSPRSPTITALGDSARFIVSARDEFGNAIQNLRGVLWSSTDTTIVRASQPDSPPLSSVTGAVAKAEGTARVIARLPGVGGTPDLADTAVVTVRQAVNSIEMASTLTVTVADSALVYAVARNEHSVALTGVRYAWSSSDPSTVAVDSAGVIRGLKRGTAYLTVSAGGKSATSLVLVLEPFFAKALATGEACALSDSGAPFCWGTNGALVPTPLPGGVTFASMSGSAAYGCGLDTSGAAYCWGNNSSGQLGDGTTQSSTTRVRVAGGRTFTQITVAGSFACALETSGTIDCWGGNGPLAVLGDGTTTPHSVPMPVAGTVRFRALASRIGGAFVCAIAVDDRAYCWGAMQLPGHTVPCAQPAWYCSTTPRPVDGDVRFRAIDAGADTGGQENRGLSVDGAIFCWGWNARTPEASAPTLRDKSHVYRSLSFNGYSGCAIATDARTYCWYYNAGTRSVDYSALPIPIAEDHGFTAVAAGRSRTCGVTSTQRAYCWGSGPLGNGLRDSSPTPVGVGFP